MKLTEFQEKILTALEELDGCANYWTVVEKIYGHYHSTRRASHGAYCSNVRRAAHKTGLVSVSGERLILTYSPKNRPTLSNARG